MKKDSEDLGIDPFLHNVTMHPFAINFIEEPICPRFLIPENGYHPEQKQS